MLALQKQSIWAKKGFWKIHPSSHPDVIIQSDSLSPMINFMKNHSNIGLCGCKLLHQDHSLQYSKGSFPSLFSILLFRLVLPRRMRKYHLWGYERLAMWLGDRRIHAHEKPFDRRGGFFSMRITSSITRIWIIVFRSKKRDGGLLLSEIMAYHLTLMPYLLDTCR